MSTTGCSRHTKRLMDFDRGKRYHLRPGDASGGSGMEGRLSPEYAKAAQRLADLHEDLGLIRYPTRVQMLRAVDEAARRAESLARLEYALQRLRLP